MILHYRIPSLIDVIVALAIIVAGAFSDFLVRTAEGAECVGGQCPNQSAWGSVGMFGRATARPDGSVTLRGGLGGASMRVGMEPAIHASCVLPVFFGSDPSPAAGVYVGVIEGRGITLTCWHAARHGVRCVGRERPVAITQDKYGYDMAAVLTRPLEVPVAILGAQARQGEEVTVIGYPGDRYGTHTGRVMGYFEIESGQPWGDLMIDASSSDGDSGGAVLNSSGQLVGLVWGTAADGSSSTAAVSGPAIADFLCRIQIMLAGEEPAEETALPIPGSSSSGCELAILVQQNAEAIAVLVATASVPGPQGEPGPPGKKGETGLQGKAFDIAALTDEQILALAFRLPPVRLQTITTEGEIIHEASARLGVPLKLRLVPVPSGGK